MGNVGASITSYTILFWGLLIIIKVLAEFYMGTVGALIIKGDFGSGSGA